MKKVKLSPLQEKFCLEYVKTGFVGQAYINAGYKAKNKIIAEANGRRLLEKEYIKNRIKEILDEIKSDEIATAEEVLKYLTKGIRMQLYEEVVVVENTGDYQSEAKIIKKQISIKDANKCSVTDKIGLLTEAMFRKYSEQGLLDLDDWWWLITPHAGTSYFARYVSTDGTLDDNIAYRGIWGVRPALYVESKIEVELEEDEIDLSPSTLLEGLTTRQLVEELFRRIGTDPVAVRVLEHCIGIK